MEQKTAYSVGVLGAGTWGAALARMLGLTGKTVTVWSALPQELEVLRTTRRHPKLPHMELPETITYTADLGTACRDKDILLFAVPSPYVRTTARAVRPFITAGQILVDAAKGIEPATLLTLTEVMQEELGTDTAACVALSGPTHAEEVALGLPTTIVAAHPDDAIAAQVQRCFTSPFMRVYTSRDRRGVEIAGALKNIIALGTGISAGLGFGDNARAALITRGLAELSRLGERIGCRPQTFGGLAGVGDLIVTCTSEHSRNNRCGRLIGQGVPPDEAVRQVGMVVEGINALPAAMALADRAGVEMPIVFTVNAIINGHVSPAGAVQKLLQRELKAELPPETLEGGAETL